MERYDIAAILDNNREGGIGLSDSVQVSVLKPTDAAGKDIPIILAVRDFYSAWLQLRGLGIDSSRIRFPNEFYPYTEEEKVFHDGGGAFQITDGDIWYVNEKRKYLIDSSEMLENLPKSLERDRVDASFLTNQAPVSPLNRMFGFSRGTPIDRYYMEKWLESNKTLIGGDVLEIAEDTYTKRFGGDNVISHILHVNMEQEGVIKGNLETG